MRRWSPFYCCRMGSVIVRNVKPSSRCALSVAVAAILASGGAAADARIDEVLSQ